MGDERDADPPLASLSGWIDEWAERPAEQIAFRFEGSQVSYPELARRVDTVAARLAGLGVESGDRIVYCGLNRIDVFELFFAASRLGAVFCPLNNRLTAHELSVLLIDAEPRLTVAADGLATTLEAARARSSQRFELVDLDAGDFHGEGSGDSRAPGVAPEAGSPTAPALMVYTSGTTGRSKGAVLRQDALHVTALNGALGQGFDDGDVILSCLPNFHVGGLNIQVLPGLLVGATIVLERRFDPVRVLSLLDEWEVSQTLLVPAMLTAVAALPEFPRARLRRLRGVMSGSSLVPESATRPWSERGIPVGQVYGATETGPTAALLRPDEAPDHPDSCGRPAPFTEIRVVDPVAVDGRGPEGWPSDGPPECPRGAAGELWVKGRHLFSAYWRLPEATAESLALGWYRTGDVGYQAEDGYLYINDRIKDVVISGGENIYPAEVEQVLIEHPAIAEVAVIGRADDQWGEQPVAVAQLVGGASLTLAELDRWAAPRLARYKMVRDLIIVDDLPRTALGKVQKNILRRRVAGESPGER